MARLWYYLRFECNRAIEIRRGWLFRDTWAVTVTSKKVVLAIDHLGRRQRDFLFDEYKPKHTRMGPLNSVALKWIVESVSISTIAAGALTDSAYLTASIS